MSNAKYILMELRLRGIADPITFSNAPFDIEHDGKSYLATHDMLKIGDMEHNFELLNDGIDITLSGVNPQRRSVIEQQAFRGAAVDILTCDVTDNTSTATNVRYYHRGYAGTPVTEFDETSGTITVHQKTQSAFKNLDKSNILMKTSLASHQALHPDFLDVAETTKDMFFQYTSDTLSFGVEQWSD